MSESPIFYDPSGRRRRWSLRVMLALIVLILGAVIAFAMTIVSVPTPDPLRLGTERTQPRPLSNQVSGLSHALKRKVRALERQLGWLPAKPHRIPGHQTVVGFYVPWDDSSRASLAAHVGELDWLVADLVSVVGPDHRFLYAPSPPMNAILAGSQRRPSLFPMVQNALGGKWDSAGAAKLLHDPAARARLLDQMTQVLVREKARGVVFDIEELPPAAQPDYRRFIAEARARFAPRHWLVMLAVPVDNEDWNLRAYAKLADRLFLLTYDEHYPGGQAGPIASQRWFLERLRETVAAVGRDKAIVAFGNYAYNWRTGSTVADPLSVEDAWIIADDSGAELHFDAASGNSWFEYEDGDGTARQVWLLDAASAWNELRAITAMGASGVALWRMGGEDPGVWAALANRLTGRVPDIGTIPPPYNVDVEPAGEILRIENTPTAGKRRLTVDAHGLIRDQHFDALPTPYVVQQYGYHPGYVALTFDDGPDPVWTPKILDILRDKHAPATFFVVGENAVPHPVLLRRIIAEGNEIGNHTYTHPNLALTSQHGARFEFNTTQRLVQAYTGHSMRLFRAPYFGDAEPSTADEIGPALEAQKAGYINVGLHVDPGDWKHPGVQAIIDRTIEQVESGDQRPVDQVQPGETVRSGQIVLLHDAGGDRQQTVDALPVIIDRLRALGYKLVPVSQLAGLTPAQVNPEIAGTDLLAVRIDVSIFLFMAFLSDFIRFLFFVAIALGTARAVLLAALAIRSNFRRNRPEPPPIEPDRFVSVIIPAFNEARVIEQSVHRVLASTDVRLEVIVVDDGSTDGTSAIVETAFNEEPRVRLLTLVNGGKARALNEALRHAQGEVIVALDADTHFEPETIARLSRWFADPEIGAVAGNAKVGNRVNLVTRWQAVEYVTAQNLERRALTRFEAITVVPGAVGAWRRAALDAVGGYPTDTLAEDQDLTIAVQRAGWRAAYDVDAVAWTEAPETFGALSRQRFRWAYGTLQCLWKHRGILRARKPPGLAFVGIPQAWLFQIAFALISPIIDFALAMSMIATAVRVHQHGWAQTQSDVLRMAAYWLAFALIDVICGWIAYRLEPREKRYPVFLLMMQRFIYRQIMYSVVVRAVAAAVRGPMVGWGKLERSGRVEQRT